MANAIIMFGPMPYLNQTMISGPSATFGIMLRLTSSGMTDHLERARPGEQQRDADADDDREDIAAEDLRAGDERCSPPSDSSERAAR